MFPDPLRPGSAASAILTAMLKATRAISSVATIDFRSFCTGKSFVVCCQDRRSLRDLCGPSPASTSGITSQSNRRQDICRGLKVMRSKRRLEIYSRQAIPSGLRSSGSESRLLRKCLRPAKQIFQQLPRRVGFPPSSRPSRLLPPLSVVHPPETKLAK